MRFLKSSMEWATKEKDDEEKKGWKDTEGTGLRGEKMWVTIQYQKKKWRRIDMNQYKSMRQREKKFKTQSSESGCKNREGESPPKQKWGKKK